MSQTHKRVTLNPPYRTRFSIWGSDCVLEFETEMEGAVYDWLLTRALELHDEFIKNQRTMTVQAPFMPAKKIELYKRQRQEEILRAELPTERPKQPSQPAFNPISLGVAAGDGDPVMEMTGTEVPKQTNVGVPLNLEGPTTLQPPAGPAKRSAVVEAIEGRLARRRSAQPQPQPAAPSPPAAAFTPPFSEQPSKGRASEDPRMKVIEILGKQIKEAWNAGMGDIRHVQRLEMDYNSLALQLGLPKSNIGGGGPG